jgi:glutamate carboxypeptidase
MSIWLEDLGFQKNSYSRELIGDHLLFLSKKKNGTKILLLGHNDTVFPPDTFESVTEDEDWIYGPGACDMKGGNIVALQALRNIYNQNNEIFNIDFLLVSDEESGSDDSKFLTSDIAKNYDLCFVFEAAGENMEVVTQRKGVGTFTIHIEGKAAHAGNHYSKGIDANLEASYKLQELVKLTNLDLETTVNVGKINGGIGANTISPKCEITLELRYTLSDEKERVLNAIDRIVKKSYVQGSVSTLIGSIQRDVMEENSNQLELINTIEKIANIKQLTEKRGGVSDANIVASCGVTTLDGFGPYGDGDHTVKERALKSSFQTRIDLLLHQ